MLRNNGEISAGEGNEAPAQLDANVNNGDFITKPQHKKVSKQFKYYETLNDSECSEDYDQDMFFEGNNPEDLSLSTALTDPQSAGTLGQIGINNERNEMLINHPNQLIASMPLNQQD